MKRTIRGWGELKKLKAELATLYCSSGRKRFAPLLPGVGLLVLLYVSGQYWQIHAAQQRLAREWLQQNTRPAGIEGSERDALVRLTIPKIKLDAVVVEGSSNKALKIGPAHLESSVLPGYAGNSVIAGHRDTFFRHLDELQPGDEIYVQRQGKMYQFEVTGKRIVPPTNISVLQPSPSPQLTLITCYPTHYIGPAPKRLAITADLATPKR